MSEENQLLLRAVPGFQSISQEALANVAASCVLRRFRAGTELLQDETSGGGLYLVAAGTVALQRGSGRKAVRVGRVCPGEVFSRLSTGGLDEEDQQEDLVAIAEHDVVVLEVPQWRFRELLDAADYELSGPVRRALIISLGRAVRLREQRIARLEVDAGTALPPGQRRRVEGREDTEPPPSTA